MAPVSTLPTTVAIPGTGTSKPIVQSSVVPSSAVGVRRYAPQ